MASIRNRLMIVLAAGFAVLIIGTGLVMERVLEARVTEEFDVALLATARALVALTEQEDGKVQLDYEPAAFPAFEREDDPDYFSFWLDDGKLLLTSRRLVGDLPRMAPVQGGERIRDMELPGGRPGRLVQVDYVPAWGGDLGDLDGDAFTATPGPKRGLTLVVARSRERLDDLIRGILVAILGIGALTTVLAGLLVWRALAVGLAPVDRIAARVEALDADSLDARVELPRTPRELAPIVDQLNALLARLHASFERERRFAGNVAHELRTPIAELRALAEVGGRWPGDEASVAAFFDDVEDIAGRMEGVVADLLLLARCQAGIETAEHRPVGLRDAILDAWANHEGRASAAGLRVDLDVPPDLVLDSDAGKLGLILTNVLGNAVSYARPRSEVRASAKQEGARFRLDVANPADPLGAEDLARLAEPFWRKDPARAAPDHAGLGLSVVCELATLLGLVVGFSQDPEGTFRVWLTGPSRGRTRAPTVGIGAS